MINIGEYNNTIQDIWVYLMLDLLPILLGGFALIIIAVIGLCKRLFKKSVVLLMLLFSIIVLTYAITEISLFHYDVRNANFDVYCGEFYYASVTGNSWDDFEAIDDSDLYVRSVAKLGISDGSHSGYVLYGKASRWVIATSEKPFELSG